MNRKVFKKSSKTPLKGFLSQIIKSRLFTQNLLYIGSIMVLFLLIFALIVYNQSLKILTNEFSSSSAHQLEITANATDIHLKDMRYIIASLDKNKLVQAFFSYNNPEKLYEEYQTRLQELLASYVNSYSSIDSIYLYSGLSDTIMTATSVTSFPNFRDSNWADFLTEEAMSEKLLIFPRSKNGLYPYLLCIMKPLEINGSKAAIILNLNLSKLSYLTNVDSDPHQEIYLVSDSGEVLYRYNQQDLLEPLDMFPKLASLQFSTDTASTVVSGASESYIVTQIHSQDYPWYYVTITNLETYTKQLSNTNTLLLLLFSALFFFTLLITFIFSVHSTKPIHKLLVLLKDPHNAVPSGPKERNEIQYISEQIVNYAQLNKELSDELTKRLNLLNETKLLALQSQINPHFLFNTLNMIYTYECEELGYKHKLPKLTLNLSQLLRYAFQSTNLVPLDTELNFTRMYLTLMQERHNNRFHVIYDISSCTLNTQVPKLFIQPLVENAIFHGLSKSKLPERYLKITSCILEDVCTITVSDNGVGMDTQTLEMLRNITDEQNPQNTSIGLRNVIIRMKLLYGNDFIFTIDSKVGEGSTFMLQFPSIFKSNL